MLLDSSRFRGNENDHRYKNMQYGLLLLNENQENLLLDLSRFRGNKKFSPLESVQMFFLFFDDCGVTVLQSSVQLHL